VADTLKLIETLRTQLSPDASLAEAEDWWPIVQRIEASLEFDPRYSKSEKETVGRLKQWVSEAILAVRQGLNPQCSSIAVSLTALQGSLERRTIGEDGWPLRS